MASSLGNAFGVAISSTVYSVLAAQLNLTLGGFTGVMFNALIALLAFLSILFLIPKNSLMYKYSQQLLISSLMLKWKI